VRVHAAGDIPTELSWVPTWTTRAGKPRPLPVILGHEPSGELVALGAGVRDVCVGTWCTGSMTGAWADYCMARVADFAPQAVLRRSRSRGRHIDFRSGGLAGVGRACR